MRKLLFAIGIITFTCHIGSSQDYKVKKKTGSILKDKEEVAKVEGKVSAFKDSYMEIYQNEQLVLSIKQNYWYCPYKEMESFPYYEFEFPELGEKFNVRTNYTFTNEKQIIKNLMAANGLHFYKDGFKQSEIDLIKASDVVQSIHRDTTEWNETLASWREHIENYAPQVNAEENDQVSFRKIDSRMINSKFLPKNATHFIFRKSEIPAGEKYPVIGVVSYVHITREENYGRAIHEIQFFKSVDSPIDYFGSESYYVPFAYCDLTSMNDKKYVSYLDGELNTYLSFSQNLDDGEWEKRIQVILDDLVKKEMF